MDDVTAVKRVVGNRAANVFRIRRPSLLYTKFAVVLPFVIPGGAGDLAFVRVCIGITSLWFALEGTVCE